MISLEAGRTGVSCPDGATLGSPTGGSGLEGKDVFRRCRCLGLSEADDVDRLSRGRGRAEVTGEAGDCVTAGGEAKIELIFFLALLKKVPRDLSSPSSLFAGVSDILLGDQK